MNSKYLLVDKKILPSYYEKVIEARSLLSSGKIKDVSEAVREVGISRSTYYKYKDSVFNYEEQFTNKIVSVYCVLRDEKGVLSSIISKLYELNTNILTINQNIPIDSVATVTISLRFDHEIQSTANLKKELLNLNGVVDVKIISGE